MSRQKTFLFTLLYSLFMRRNYVYSILNHSQQLSEYWLHRIDLIFFCEWIKVLRNSIPPENIWKKKSIWEFPLWLSVLRTQHSLREDVGWIHGLAWWIKALALPQAAVYVTDAAWICHCCGCSIGLQLQLWFAPSLGTSICHRRGCKKKKKKSIWAKIYRFLMGFFKNEEASPECVWQDTDILGDVNHVVLWNLWGQPKSKP